MPNSSKSLSLEVNKNNVGVEASNNSNKRK